MNAQTVARQTTTCLIREAIERFGPLTEREIGEMLDEHTAGVGRALNRLITLGHVGIERTADSRTVLYGARRRP